jgi:hypothetical protein
MKRGRRVVAYLVTGVVCMVAAAVLLAVTRLRGHPSLGLAELLFGTGIALMLLAKVTQVDARIRALEEFQRQEACRERALSHDAGEGEKEEPESV